MYVHSQLFSLVISRQQKVASTLMQVKIKGNNKTNYIENNSTTSCTCIDNKITINTVLYLTSEIKNT